MLGVLVLHHCRFTLHRDCSSTAKLKSTALIVYALLVLGTGGLGPGEVGSDFFALAPRLDILVYLAYGYSFQRSHVVLITPKCKMVLIGSLAITIAG